MERSTEYLSPEIERKIKRLREDLEIKKAPCEVLGMRRLSYRELAVKIFCFGFAECFSG